MTAKGIGNGISIIILVGIISRLPYGIGNLWGLVMTEGGFSTTGLLIVLGIIAVAAYGFMFCVKKYNLFKNIWFYC